MQTKDILLELRKKNNLSQDKMAEKLLVTRQAVSRWENGETIPNTDTLKIISKTFGDVHQHFAWAAPQHDLSGMRFFAG